MQKVAGTNVGSGTTVAPVFPEAPSLALTFLFAGLAYALPTLLFRESHPLNGPISPEVLNLNFLVAWMGLAHFVFAYQGQALSLRKQHRRAGVLFVAGLAASAILLFLLRKIVPSRIFDFAIWVYFIPHFIKAELHFNGTGEKNVGWVLFWFPALCFGFLTFALFGPKELSLNTALLIVPAILCMLAGVAGGIARQLYTSNAKYALLAFFFLAEALVWGTYSKYMTPQFRQGVYVFHIAVASFFHYFRSYGFALRKCNRVQHLNRGVAIFCAFNLIIIISGIAAMHSDGTAISSLFDVGNFTFWVGLHLMASDLFSFFGKRKRQTA